MCRGYLHLNVGTFRGQKRISYFQELETKMVVDLGSARAAFNLQPSKNYNI